MMPSQSRIPETKTDKEFSQIHLKNNDLDNIENQIEEDNNYRHLYVVLEQEEGTLLPVSFEMLGEARRLMNNFNSRYNPKEKVVAIILGYNVKHLCKDIIYY